MDGKGRFKTIIGKVKVNVTYQYSNLTEETIEKFNEMLARTILQEAAPKGKTEESRNG